MRMNVHNRKPLIAYLSLAAAIISLCSILYTKWHFVFQDMRVAVLLVWTGLISWLISAILGVYAYRSRKSITAFIILAIVTYFFLFTPLYAVV